MSSQLSNRAEDRYVDGLLGERFHYRRFGTDSGVPLYLHLFFPETKRARAAGLASSRCLDVRPSTSAAAVRDDTHRGPLTAIGAHDVDRFLR